MVTGKKISRHAFPSCCPATQGRSTPRQGTQQHARAPREAPLGDGRSWWAGAETPRGQESPGPALLGEGAPPQRPGIATQPSGISSPCSDHASGQMHSRNKGCWREAKAAITPVSLRWEENVAEMGRNCPMAPGSRDAAQLPNVYANAGPGACPPCPSSEQAPENRCLRACRGRRSWCRRSCSRCLSWCRHVFALLV